MQHVIGQRSARAECILESGRHGKRGILVTTVASVRCVCGGVGGLLVSLCLIVIIIFLALPVLLLIIIIIIIIIINIFFFFFFFYGVVIL